jgi:translocation and assembly module TamB
VIRRRIAILFLPMGLILLLAGVFYWAMHTESGADWIWQRVVAAVPGKLQVRQLRGDLQSGLQLLQLDYQGDGVAVTADKVGLRMDLDLLPPAIGVQFLEFGELTLRTEKQEEETGAPPAESLPQLALPLPVTFHAVRGHRLAWQGADAEEPLELRDLSLVAAWSDELELRQLRFRGGPADWRARGLLGLTAPFPMSLEVAADVAVDTDGPALVTQLAAQLDGDLSRLRLSLQADRPAAELKGELFDLLEVPQWDLQLSAERLTWPLFAAEPDLVLEEVFAAGYGGVAEFTLEMQTALQANDLPLLETRLLATGDGAGLDFRLLQLSGDGFAASGAGRLDWQDAVEIRADLEVAGLDPVRWVPDWQDAEPASGQLRLGWQGARLDFTAEAWSAPGTVGRLDASGAFDFDAQSLQADLSWREFAWPPGGGSAMADGPSTLESGAGQATLRGSLDEWTLAGELAVGGADIPAGQLRLEGTGDRESARFTVPRGEVLGGRLAGEFGLRWSPQLQWSVSATVDNLATGPLVPAFPGRLSGGLAARGQAEPLQWEVDLRGLQGTLRQRPVAADGRIALREGLVVAQELDLRSGQSRLRLDGHPATEAGLTFDADITTLADFLDGASGAFAGRGRLSLHPARPQLFLDGSGSALAWADLRIPELQLTSEPLRGEPLRLEAEGIELGESRIDLLHVEMSGQPPLQRLDATVQFAGNELQLALRGGVIDWTAPWSRGWSGQLEELRLQAADNSSLELGQPAELRVSDAGLQLEPACLQGSRQGQFCAEVGWQPGRDLQFVLQLDQVSPNLALSLLGSDLAFTQRLSGSVDWRLRPRVAPLAQVALTLSPGRITADDGEVVLVETGQGRFGFEIAEGRLYSGRLIVPVVGAGGIDAEFGAPDLGQGLDSALEGRLRIDLASIEPLLLLIPGVEGGSGPVAADLSFSGSLAAPELTGHASIVRGRVSYFASGLLLEDITLAGSVYRYGRAQLNGRFRAGEGQGRIDALVDFSDLLAPDIRLELRGQDLTLVNVPDLQLKANPEVQLGWREGWLSVDGRVVVPSARISPRFLPTSTAAESPDLVVVAGEDPLAEAMVAPAPERRIAGRLELELGDDVTLALDKAVAKIGGKATFSWDGQLLPVAEGGFMVSGEINAYGQSLQVSEGRVNFAGRPADNPFLNVRAEREIFGNSQIRRAGLLVTGTLKEPVLEPYTVPMTTRERALALLVTGNDFDYEQGVGSVEVGMYVAPKLFVSYGVGLFEDQNVISLRYDLGRGFGIKTSSGQRETGADISYTIER